MTTCRRCTEGLLHCHGTLVTHDDGSVECTSPECTGGVVHHDYVIACADIQAACCASADGVGVATAG